MKCLCLFLAWALAVAPVVDAAIITIHGPVRHGSGGGGGGTIGPISIAADADDGDINETPELASNGDNGDGHGWFGSVSTSTAWVYLRFILPSGISSGATITSATLTVFGRDQFSWVNGTDDIQIRATDSANASAPTTGTHRPSAISGGSTSTTTAVAAWNNVTWNTSGTNTSSDISSVIQELVTDNGGLSSSAGIVLWINTTATSHYAALELNERAGSANVATLTITWTP